MSETFKPFGAVLPAGRGMATVAESAMHRGQATTSKYPLIELAIASLAPVAGTAANSSRNMSTCEWKRPSLATRTGKSLPWSVE